MKSIAIFITLLFVFVNTSFGQIIEENYRHIYKAEFHILNSKLDSAIPLYNLAYRIAPLTRTDVEQYIMLLEKDSALGKIYFDTLLYFLAHYNQHIERYANFKIVENALKSNIHKKFPLKNPKINYNCSELEGIFVDIVRENSKINRKKNAILGTQDTAGLIFDSIAYFRICSLLQLEKYQPCLNTFFLISTVYNIAADHRRRTSNALLDTILINAAKAKSIDKSSLGRFLDYIHDSSDSYQSLFPEIHIFRKTIVYEKLDSTQLSILNKRRAEYSIESFQDYLEKIILQLEKNSSLWRLRYFNHINYAENEGKDAVAIYDLLSNTEKKFEAYKLKINGNSYLFKPAMR
jgi:hypothetical protein